TIDRINRHENDAAKLAKQLSPDGVRRIAAIRSRNSDQAEWGVYDTFYFDTKTGEAATAGSVQIPAIDPSDRQAKALTEIIEEILPFYSDSSVQLRELVHDKAADDSWEWKRRGTELLLLLHLHVAPDARQPQATSRVPSFLEHLTDGSA